MQLNRLNLGATKLHHVIDVMDMVILNSRKNASHSSHNTGLLTVMNVTSTNDVGTDLFL